MHVLFIHQFFLTPAETGSTRHFELARHLVQSGHRVTVIRSNLNYMTGREDQVTPADLVGRGTVDGINMIRAWTYRGVHKNYSARLLGFLSFMASSLWSGLRLKDADIVIACSPQIFTGITGWLIGRLRRIPFVFEIRDLWPRFAIEMGVLKNPVFIALARGLEKFIYRRADSFIINSSGFASHLKRFGIPDDRVFLIPNGVNTEFFQPGQKNNSVRRDYWLDSNFIVMYAGAHGPANDLDTVLRAAELLKGHPDIKFLLVGDGKEKQRLINSAHQRQLDNIIFADAQPKENMPEFCHAADICLAILQKRDAFKTVYPNKLFDYMASGRPVILAIDGVGREILEKAEAGVFVEPENPEALAAVINGLYRDRKDLDQWGMNGRWYVQEHFERNKIAEKLKTVLENICENDKRRHAAG